MWRLFKEKWSWEILQNLFCRSSPEFYPDIRPDNHVGKGLLYGIIKLDIQVYVFSFAKDVIQKHKVHEAKQTKSKSLHKEISREYPSPPLGAKYNIVGFDATNSIYNNYERAKVKAIWLEKTISKIWPAL